MFRSKAVGSGFSVNFLAVGFAPCVPRCAISAATSVDFLITAAAVLLRNCHLHNPLYILIITAKG